MEAVESEFQSRLQHQPCTDFGTEDGRGSLDFQRDSARSCREGRLMLPREFSAQPDHRILQYLSSTSSLVQHAENEPLYSP